MLWSETWQHSLQLLSITNSQVGAGDLLPFEACNTQGPQRRILRFLAFIVCCPVPSLDFSQPPSATWARSARPGNASLFSVQLRFSDGSFGPFPMIMYSQPLWQWHLAWSQTGRSFWWFSHEKLYWVWVISLYLMTPEHQSQINHTSSQAVVTITFQILLVMLDRRFSSCMAALKKGGAGRWPTSMSVHWEYTVCYVKGSLVRKLASYRQWSWLAGMATP